MRVRAHLAAQERWDDLFAADDWLREVQNLPPTRVVDGRLVADFPADVHVGRRPARTTSAGLAPLESHFEGAVEHLEWGDALRITGWAWLRGLDVRAPQVRAWLVVGRGERVPVAAQQVHLPEADVWGPLSFASPADGGFVLTVDAADALARPLGGRGRAGAGRPHHLGHPARPGRPLRGGPPRLRRRRRAARRARVGRGRPA